MTPHPLPGATRTSSLFVFPLEMAIWGGGALLIRAAVRHFKLGWLNMFLMACALSIAEEFVIQQTTIAPLIIQIAPGPPFGRAFGINYEYFLWALFYEAVLVVMVPVMVTELIFEDRREDLLQFFGHFHGGVITALADQAAGIAVTSGLPKGRIGVTVELKVNFMEPARGTELIARAKTLKMSGSIGVAMVEIFSKDEGNETLCAFCTATMRDLDLPAEFR